MKIGILTQPLHNNYGGLLQNFALQKTLKDMGHEVWTIDRNFAKIPAHRKYASAVKRCIIGLTHNKIPDRTWLTTKEERVISKYTSLFIENYIQKTPKIYKTSALRRLHKKYSFDAYIVGSDQVWRPRYSPQQPTYFLDFLEKNTSVKKIAYAASFGVSDWEFTREQTKEFKRLLKLFDAVSVREDSGVDLCKRYFDVDAIQLLDPTMLLDKEEYISLVNKQNLQKSSGSLFTYILDKNDDKSAIVNSVADKFKLDPFSVMPKRSFSEPGRKDINDCVFPPVEEWIKGFIDAEFVITDSFHGTVFSILFNKPFIAIANKSRGLTRFESLLKLFQLEDRLVFPTDNFNIDNLNEINWEKTNAILVREKKRSMEFIKKFI
jgi:polysaccharide pyruvyl transferase WcaK-like protein